jgi:hypothetical protein
MINISDRDLVGTGRHRKVYIHPDNDKLCIKVIYDGIHDAPAIEREKSYYRHLQKRQVSWEMLPAYHGDVITNIGEGSVFDLVTDDNNKVSRTLGHYVSSNELTKLHFKELVDALNSFKQYLISQRIYTIGIAHRNIVCQVINSKIEKIHIVDNIGNLEFIPISNYFDFRAKKKVNKKWKRFEEKLLAEFPLNEDLAKIFLQVV